ncbi:MAG: hypothetical protein HYZ37_13460 [Candidatus Solibacter usitatus]|nr:hypothetical protein [Candidatus Solibacter usitatus]
MLLSQLALSLVAVAATVPIDTSKVRPGPVSVRSSADSVIVSWPDAQNKTWDATFSLDPALPLLTSIRSAGKTIITRGQPNYRCETGKRRGGWDQFFDYPPSHPEGTRRFEGKFKLTSARAATNGDRVVITFDGLDLGIFQGSLAFTFYPGTRLMLQEAVVSTEERDVAYYYEAGLRFDATADRGPGRTMNSEIAFYDTTGTFRRTYIEGSDRNPERVRYRTLAARTQNGAIAVFPLPHRYFFARDYTTNMGYVWHTAWRGNMSIGIRQLPDDYSPFYPWINAPPETEQHMGVFYQLSDAGTREVVDDVLRYTNSDRYAPLPGYKTFTSHWHLSYTEQAMAKGIEWTPPFKPVMKAMGIDAAMIADFHGDGHPQDLTDLRLRELDAYFKACRAQSDKDFLLMPSEEANVHLGGHWVLAFPKPVYWHMGAVSGKPFRETHPQFGTVYHVANARQMLDLIRAENGLAYQAHPRTKGSMGFPDTIQGTEHFRDDSYFGAGWKAMNSDLSLPYLGARPLKLLDDMSNWGLRKRLLAESDVFQIDSTHELYSHMNINYVRLAGLPTWDRYGDIFTALRRGDFFLSTGEVLLPKSDLREQNGKIQLSAEIRNTFPLEYAEVVWGDGVNTHTSTISLNETRPFATTKLERAIDAKGWKWARFAVWDIAANGAMTNPVWR